MSSADGTSVKLPMSAFLAFLETRFGIIVDLATSLPGRRRGPRGGTLVLQAMKRRLERWGSSATCPMTSEPSTSPWRRALGRRHDAVPAICSNISQSRSLGSSTRLSAGTACVDHLAPEDAATVVADAPVHVADRSLRAWSGHRDR